MSEPLSKNKVIAPKKKDEIEYFTLVEAVL